MLLSKTTPESPKILIVDDEDTGRAYFCAVLTAAGYRVITANNGNSGLQLCANERPALVLLDIEMPELNGWDTLIAMRKMGFDKTVIMLTGLTQIEHRVKGLSNGADDYICKPCDPRELLARVNAFLRRSEKTGERSKLLHFSRNTEVNLTERVATRNGEPLSLSKTEFGLLDVLFKNRGQLVTRENMLEVVWGYSRESSTRTVDTHIWRLRAKLEGDENDVKRIQTVAGFGYRLAVDERER